MRRTIKFLVGLPAVALLAGCATSPTFVAPNSMVSSHEANLYRILLIMSAVVFLLVESLLIYNIIRFRSRPGNDGIPKQTRGNNRLEVIWTGIPLLTVAVIFGLTLTTVNAVAPPPASAQDLNLQVVGHQWWWEFDYPDLGIVTANELHLPVGATAQLEVSSIDVIHSFWVPQLSGKIDAVPGQTNHLWIKADQVGSFHGQCAEFCGLNHANMRIKVVVESQADFEAWAANQQQPPVAPQTDLQQAGMQITTQGICNSCHTIGDNKAGNEIGPNLTHLMSRSVFAGATYDLNEANLRHWLEDNQSMKPGNAMSLNPKPDEIDPLIAYLTSLK
jgi:cytochrome c oxidase subunit 2